MDRTWWPRALTCSVIRPIMSWFLFLKSYERTGLWHPCWQCWGAGCRNPVIAGEIRDMPGVFQSDRISMHRKCEVYIVVGGRNFENLLWPMYLLLFYMHYYNDFSLTVFFHCGASVCITASVKYFRPRIAVWFRVFRMHTTPLRISETFNWDTLNI